MPERPGPRILLLDDEALWLRSLGRLIASRGAHPETFTKPEDALDGLARGPWDLLVVDYQLGNGWTGARWAKAARERMKGGKMPPIILVSGALERVGAEERRYFDAVYPKSMEAGALLDEIAATLAERKGRPRSHSRLRTLGRVTPSTAGRKRRETPT